MKHMKTEREWSRIREMKKTWASSSLSFSLYSFQIHPWRLFVFIKLDRRSFFVSLLVGYVASIYKHTFSHINYRYNIMFFLWRWIFCFGFVISAFHIVVYDHITKKFLYYMDVHICCYMLGMDIKGTWRPYSPPTLPHHHRDHDHHQQ